MNCECLSNSLTLCVVSHGNRDDVAGDIVSGRNRASDMYLTIVQIDESKDLSTAFRFLKREK